MVAFRWLLVVPQGQEVLHHQASAGHTISQAATADSSSPVKANHVISAPRAACFQLHV